jgi:hypothetical protein
MLDDLAQLGGAVEAARPGGVVEAGAAAELSEKSGGRKGRQAGAYTRPHLISST